MHSYIAAFAHSKERGSSWEELVSEKKSTVILGEPGSGKTDELRATCALLRAQGKLAVSFDIASMINASAPPLARDGLETLALWRAGKADAWLFLDSVDESKLTRVSDFHTAIDRVASWVGPQWERTYYVISSRITEWRHHIDKPYVDQALGIDISPYRLLPLQATQVELLVADRGGNAKDFILAIEEIDAWEFVGRPQDAIDLHDLWLATGQLGSKLEMLKQATELKLKLKDDRSGIPIQKLKAGVEHIAACLHLTKTLAIRLDITGESSTPDALTTRQIFPPEWSAAEQKSLLQRAIFSDAAFGCIRMHHRTHQDFLAAKWLMKLMSLDCPYSELQQLAFHRHSDSTLVLRPFMRNVVAWLACLAPSEKQWTRMLLSDLVQAAPGIFLAAGDPKSLSVEVRRQFLQSLVASLKGREHVNVPWDGATLKRFAHPELEKDLSTWIVDRGTGQSLRADLIILARQGALKGTLEAIVSVAVNNTEPHYLRATAIGCIEDIGLDEHKRQILEAAGLEDSIPERLMGWIIRCVYPSVADENELFNILKKMDWRRHRHEVTSMHNFEREVIEEATGLAHAKRLLFLSNLMTFVVTPGGDLKADKHWALNWLQPTIKNLLDAQSLSDEQCGLVLDALAMTHQVRKKHITDDWREAKTGSINNASLHHKNLRQKWFWSRYHEVRIEREVKYVFQLDSYYELLSPHPVDISWWLEDAFNTELSKQERCFALNAAITLSNNSGTKTLPAMTVLDYLDALTDREVQSVVLENFRNKFVNLFSRSKYKVVNTWGRKRFWQSKWVKIKKQYWTYVNRARFTIRRKAIANGNWDGATYHVLSLAREKISDRSSNNWSGGLTADDLMVPFGQFVGSAVIASTKLHWKKHQPILPYERENRNSTRQLTIFGLMALDVVWSKEGAGYFESLNESEAEIATRLALNELNGLPAWLPSVARGNLKVVKRVLLEAATEEWRIANANPDLNSDLFSRLRYQEKELPELVIPHIKSLLLSGEQTNNRVLLDALRIVIRLGDRASFDWLINTAKTSVLDDAGLEKESSWTWLVLLMGLDATFVLDFIESQQLKKDPAELAIKLCGCMGSRRDLGISVDSPDYANPRFLKRLIPWVYKYVPPKEDPIHDGAYSPETHDDAVTFRQTLLERLISVDDNYVEETLKDFNDNPVFDDLSDWILENLDRWKDRKADQIKLNPEDLHDLLGNQHERAPRSREDLFHLSHRKILHFKEQVEHAEISIRNQANIGIWKEKDYQRWIQEHIYSMRNGRFTIAAESEIDPGKYPDLRFEAPEIDGAISVEMKLATNWSYTKLLEGLHAQLVGQYLRAGNANFGIYLLFYDGTQKHWEPSTTESLNWQELLQRLDEEARMIRLKRLDIDQLVVIGIDVTKST